MYEITNHSKAGKPMTAQEVLDIINDQNDIGSGWLRYDIEDIPTPQALIDLFNSYYSPDSQINLLGGK